MIKEIYEKPITDIEEFKAVYVVTASSVDNDVRGDDNDVEWGS